MIKVQLISIKIADQDKVIKQTNKVNKQQTNPILNTVDMCVQVHVSPTLLCTSVIKNLCSKYFFYT